LIIVLEEKPTKYCLYSKLKNGEKWAKGSLKSYVTFLALSDPPPSLVGVVKVEIQEVDMKIALKVNKK